MPISYNTVEIGVINGLSTPLKPANPSYGVRFGYCNKPPALILGHNDGSGGIFKAPNDGNIEGIIKYATPDPTEILVLYFFSPESHKLPLGSLGFFPDDADPSAILGGLQPVRRGEIIRATKSNWQATWDAPQRPETNEWKVILHVSDGSDNQIDVDTPAAFTITAATPTAAAVDATGTPAAS